MRTRGFTLIELLVVVLIIGVLTSVAMPQYRSAMDRSKAGEAMQMLPAIFAARERWLFERGCQWSGGAGSTTYSCDDGTPSMTWRKLDTEFSATTDCGTSDRCSPNFQYILRSPSASSSQPCVAAVPRWGESRGFTSATIYYRGSDFACNDGGSGACAKLNVDETGDGTGVCD